MFSNLRQNPFTKAFSWFTITGETHRVRQYRHLPGVYGILLKEIPKPESVQVTFTGTSTEAIVVNQEPLAGQVRIDYQRGHVVFNISDNLSSFCLLSRRRHQPKPRKPKRDDHRHRYIKNFRKKT